jgi:hypothetical protein
MLIWCNMFILYIASRYSHFNILFSKPCQRQYELLPSLGVRCPFRQFLFLIGRFLKIFSETAWPNEPKLGRKHLWNVLYEDCSFRQRLSGLSLCRSPFILLWGNLIQEPSIHVDASYQVSVHMAKQFQRRRFFRNWPIRNKNCMWWPCLLTDRDEMSILHRGHSIDAS